jgi:hypothetical protein
MLSRVFAPGLIVWVSLGASFLDAGEIQSALDRNTLALASGGTVSVWERDKNQPDRWNQVADLTSTEDDPDDPQDLRWSSFGFSVALDGNTLIVGAPHEETERGVGAVYIYYRNRGGKNQWGLMRKVRATGTIFGWSVAISGDTALASSLEEGIGQTHVLERNRGGPDRWHGVQLAPSVDFPDAGCNYCDYDPMAHEVSISGDTLAINGWTVEGPGSTLIFDRDPKNPSGWKEIRRIDGLSKAALDGDTLAGVNNDRIVLHERNQRGTNRWGRLREFRSRDYFVSGARFDDVVAIRGNTLAGAWSFDAPDGGVKPVSIIFDRHAGGKNQWGNVARLIEDGYEGGWSEQLALGAQEVAHCLGYVDSIFGGLEYGWEMHHRPPLLADDFEGTDLSLWHQNKRKVAVVEPGLGGSEHALEVTLDGKKKKSFVRSKHPVDERNFSLSFLFLANNVDLAGRTVEILRFSGGRKNVELTLEEEGGEYFVGLWAGHNKGALEQIGRTKVPARKAVKLGIEWERATGPGHNNGIVRLLKKNRVAAEATDMDTDRLTINDVRLGLPSGCKGAGGGSFLVDLYDSNR